MIKRYWIFRISIFWLAITLTSAGCAQPHKTMSNTHTNALANETSPYLLQHAHNPVNWLPWGDAALQKAKEENKLIIISIGYSACHWCHVMEHESFEDSAAAALMNEKYISIKVDREERPDIDNLYTSAVQLMTGRGGWPLNCIALPDGRPIWGGTYFPKNEWMKALNDIHTIYTNTPEKVLEYAANLEAGIKQADLVPPILTEPEFKKEELQDMVENWKRRFDTRHGGPDKAPKFPLPNNYQFLLRYGWLTEDEDVTNHVKLTLNEMAFGGIYDQIGGGFARYSTDAYWKAPHFEKMLYDNAQLISLYSEAYRAFKTPLYKHVVEETFAFLQREMLGAENQFYAALDADSEGEEGKFYVWNEAELKTHISAEDWSIFEDYYNINHHGRWEHGNYILLKKVSDEDFAKKHDLNPEALKKQVEEWNTTLLKARGKRTRPGLDSKALTGWNAMMITALADAYMAFGDENYLRQAEKTAQFIRSKMIKPDGRLYHTYSPGEAKINAFLDDYAAVIEAWMALYQHTANESYLTQAHSFTQIVLEDFDAGENGLFFFTPKQDELLSRSTEVSDNVIPASNSVMARNLHALGIYLENTNFTKRAEKMAMQIKDNMYRYGEGHSNWGMLMLNYTFPSYEVVVAGPEARSMCRDFYAGYYPNVLIAYTEKESNLPLLQHRYTSTETRIFVCQNYTCQLPVTKPEDAWQQLKK